MIEWSVDALRGCRSVEAIVVAVPPGHSHGLVAGADAGPALAVVAGGETRAQSVANALGVVETELVAIHDAARPLLTAELVEALVGALAAAPEAAGVIAATPVTDTVKQAGAAGNALLAIESTLDRSRLWAAQTPQVFRADALRAALAAAAARGEAVTDEAMLIEEAGGTVLLHLAGPENLKVTTPHDLRVAEMLLSRRA